MASDELERDIRRHRRRCFWVGFRSVWDLSGRLTMRDMRTLDEERLVLIERMEQEKP